MTRHKQFTILRNKAEEILSRHPERVSSISQADAEDLIHELSVHQIELEMQNDELRRTQATAEELKERYVDLYDSAPVAYLTLTRQGVIAEANLTAASLLGYKRSLLIGKPLSAFLVSASQDIFHNHVREVLSRGAKATCELTILRKGGPLVPVYVQTRSFDTGDYTVMRSILTDITERKQAEGQQRRTNEELEKRVAERTAELIRANEALRKEIEERKRTEEVLRESEATYRELVENANSIIIKMDREGTITFFNEYAQAFFGYTNDEVIGRNIRITVPPIETASGRDLEEMADSILENPDGFIENINENVKKNGERVWVSWRNKAITDSKGNVIGNLAIGQDITGQKRAEQALRESQARFHVAQELSPNGFTILRPLRDASGNINDFEWVYENDAVARLNNTDPKEVIGRRVSEFSPAHASTPFHELYKRVIETGKADSLEAEYKSVRMPNSVWIRAVVVPMGGDIAIVGEDITERKRMEDELRKSHAHLEQRVRERTAELERERHRLYEILEVIPIRVCLLTPDYHVPFANRAFREVYGESGGRCCYDYCLGLSAPCSFCEAFKPLETGQPHHWGCTSPDGKEIIDAWEFPFTDVDSSPMILEMTIDVSGQRRLEEQLRQAHKLEAVGTLAGGIAHDFNNILAGVIGFTEMVLDDVADNPFVQQRMERVLQAAFRGRDLVRQILTFSRRSEGARKEVSLSAVVHETHALLRSSLPTTIHMPLAITTNDDYVVADPTQVQQIIMNLATNAAYAMREDGGELTIGLSSVTLPRDGPLPDPDLAPGTYVKLTVKDTGTGMTEKVRQRVFEPFFSTKEYGVGTGMGLAVVYGLVKSHGGAVTVQSEVGQGSVFEVFLPRAQRPQAGQEEPATTELPAGTERILFVDDEKLLVDAGRAMLEKLGYRVTVAQHGSEAWNLFLEDPSRFDLVITDQTMPDVTGAMLAQKMLKVRSDLPIILCTGYSEKVSADKAQKLGISAFVMKPLARKELAETVRRVLDEGKEHK